MSAHCIRLFLGTLLAWLGLVSAACGQKRHELVRLETAEGNIVILLLHDTPLHRQNFVDLAATHFFDSTFFHRIIDDFVVQGGDPNTRNADSIRSNHIGNGGPGFTIPAEFVEGYFHRLGAVGAARNGDDVNPLRRSAGSQFYLVEGRKYSHGALDTLERQRFAREWFATPTGRAYLGLNFDSLRRADPQAVRRLYAQQHEVVTSAFEAAGSRVRFSGEQRAAYTTVGGIPHLDGQYTIFGYIVEGLDVMRKLSDALTDPTDRPIERRYLLRAVPFQLSKRELEQKYGLLPMR